MFKDTWTSYSGIKGGDMQCVPWYLLVMIFAAGMILGVLVNNIVIDIRRRG